METENPKHNEVWFHIHETSDTLPQINIERKDEMRMTSYIFGFVEYTRHRTETLLFSHMKFKFCERD